LHGPSPLNAIQERPSRAPRYVIMDIGFTITVLLLVFIIATAIGFAWTGFVSR
jgi:hypothetical protein